MARSVSSSALLCSCCACVMAPNASVSGRSGYTRMLRRFCCYSRPRTVLTSETSELFVVFRARHAARWSSLRRGFSALVSAGGVGMGERERGDEPERLRNNESQQHTTSWSKRKCRQWPQSSGRTLRLSSVAHKIDILCVRELPKNRELCSRPCLSPQTDE